VSRNKTIRKVRTIGIRISDDQYEDLTKRAAEKGMSLTDFQRLIVLQAIYTPSETRLMLAEMVRLQKIILSFHATVLNGGTLTRERIDSIVREADQGKFELADQRIAAGLNVPSTLDVLKAFGGQNG
jgi:uncharacterized protein (DUF1778 family)